MGQVLFDGTGGREVRQVLLDQGNAGKEDPDLGVHKSSLKDGGSCGLEKRYVRESGDSRVGKGSCGWP